MILALVPLNINSSVTVVLLLSCYTVWFWLSLSCLYCSYLSVFLFFEFQEDIVTVLKKHLVVENTLALEPLLE